MRRVLTYRSGVTLIGAESSPAPRHSGLHKLETSIDNRTLVPIGRGSCRVPMRGRKIVLRANSTLVECDPRVELLGGPMAQPVPGVDPDQVQVAYSRDAAARAAFSKQAARRSI
jgi:hypothetical protein